MSTDLVRFIFFFFVDPVLTDHVEDYYGDRQQLDVIVIRSV